MMDKQARLLELARERQADRWPGYATIGVYHEGRYECDFVSPYTRSAANVDAQVMVLLQDWSSEEVLRGPYLAERTELGQDPRRVTNRRLKSLLRLHLGVELADTYATNVFPFVKPGAISSSVPRADLVRAARKYALPQIRIVRPALAVCLGVSAFLAVRAAAEKPPIRGLEAAIRSPFELGTTRVWCQAHTGQMGTNNRNRGGVNRVDDDWAAMARDLEDLIRGGHSSEKLREFDS